ncbi:MAG: hypothetical protein E7523_12540 [Ruminococcaceae bacterium]|nr:hypothetical protein [Oscillospiraceae bacterium]
MKSTAQTTKRVLSVLLAVLMLVGMVSAQLVFAVENNANNVSKPVEEWVYTPSATAASDSALSVAETIPVESVEATATGDATGFWVSPMEGELELRLGGEKAGMFMFKSNRNGGWSLKNEDGRYLAVANGAVTTSATEFFWQYSDNRLSTTVRTGGSYFGTTYYLSLVEGALTLLTTKKDSSLTSFYAHIENIMLLSKTTAGDLMADYPKGSFMTDNYGYELVNNMYLVTGDLLFTPDGERYIITVRGDVDGDGEVLSADARLLLRASVGLTTLDKAQILAGDVERDGRITAGDARTTLRVSVGLETLTLVSSYTVIFDLNYEGAGNTIPAQEVEEGECATQPTVPAREGYTFDGWYTTAEVGELFDFSTPINSNITLYAQWIEDSIDAEFFTVTFVLNDGSTSGAYDVQTIVPNGEAAEPLSPERENYEFSGWYTEPETINLFDFSNRIKSDLVLYAGWNAPENNDGVYSSSSGGGTIFSITDIDISDNIANVTVNVNAMSSLVLEFSDEETEEVFYTTAAQTPDYCELETVAMSVDCELPDYFVVTARLFDENGNECCNAYRSIKYTSAYEEFKNKTVYDFEDKTVLNFDESIDNNFGVLSDNVIQIEQEDNTNTLTVQTITAYDSVASEIVETVTYIFESCDSQITALEEGDIVFATDVDGVDQLFKIGAIEFAGATCTIVPSDDNSMTDFYDFLKVDMYIADQEIETRTYRVGQARSENINVEANPSFTFTPLNLTWTPKDWLDISGSLGGSISMNISFVYDIVLFGRDYFSASVKNVTKVEANITITAHPPEDDDDDQMTEKFKHEYSLPTAKIPTPITGLSVNVKVGVPVDLSAEGSATVSFTSETTSGFTYNSNSGRQDIDKKERTFLIKAEGKIELKVGPKVSVGIGFLGTVVEAKVEAQAGFKAIATAELAIVNITDAEEKHACTACVSAEARWFVEVSVKLEYDIIDKILEGEVFNLKIIDIEGKIRFDQFDTCYFSLIHSADSVFGTIVPQFGFGECPNKQYRTTIKLLDTNGAVISGNNVSIKKNNGRFNSNGVSTFVDYLYDGQYTVSTRINNRAITKTVVVSGNAQTIELKETSADGRITGKICSAEDNSAVAGATILISKDSLVVASLSSNSTGNYSVTLPDGVYCVEITKEGYIPFVQYVAVTESNETYLATALLVSGDRARRGGFCGKITDAVTGNPVAGVKLTIRKGWDNPDSGNVVAVLETDANGVFTYNITKVLGVVFGLESGNYTATTSKADYASTSFNIVVVPAIVKGGQDATIAPITQGNYRVVLRWGAVPSDLDSHMTAYTTSGAYEHVYYSDKIGSTANLDIDDTSSYGPETITITDFEALSDGFTYSVHDYSNKGSSNNSVLSSSGAVVELYKDNTLLKKYYVPTDKIGTVWRVFSIDAEGNITDINYFYNQSNANAVN